MSYEALREECARERIGPLFWSLLVEVAGRIARRYPPDIYNDGLAWSEESVADLAQDVALTRLLEENQLDYVLDAADQSPGDRLGALSRLLAFQVRRTLSHRRRKTVVDRLHSRVKTIIASPPFGTTSVAGDTVIALGDGGTTPRPLTDGQIRQAANLIRSIPRIPSRVDAERESKVYTGAHLEELVTTLVSSFGPVLLGDVRRILELTLTAWVPTVLRGDEEEHASAPTPEFELERSQMHTLIDNLVAGLDPVHRAVLIGKSQGIADGELAQRVGRSRPWLADRKAEVLTRVQVEVVEQLPDGLQDEAFRYLLDACALIEEAEP